MIKYQMRQNYRALQKDYGAGGVVDIKLKGKLGDERHLNDTPSTKELKQGGFMFGPKKASRRTGSLANRSTSDAKVSLPEIIQYNQQINNEQPPARGVINGFGASAEDYVAEGMHFQF